MKTALVLLLSLSLPVFANEIPSNDVPNAEYEAQRVEKAQKSHDIIEFMDNATPAEIEEALGISAEDAIELEGEEKELLYSPAGGGVVNISVSIRRQTLTINYPDGGFTVPVSTGRKGYSTRTGCYRPQRMHKMWYSRKYDMAPMPNSIFYYGGFAIHGTYEEKRLGRPASHGCIRVSCSSAARIYSIVAKHGMGNTRICVSGS